MSLISKSKITKKMSDQIQKIKALLDNQVKKNYKHIPSSKKKANHKFYKKGKDHIATRK